jgi:hypothetical protein
MSVDGSLIPFAVTPLDTPLGDSLGDLSGDFELTPEDRQRVADIQSGAINVQNNVNTNSEPFADEAIVAESSRVYGSLGREGYSGPLSYEVSGFFEPQRPIENPLHEYASYTYNLSLHMLSIEGYNRIVNNNFENTTPAPYVPENVLISGAGRYNDTDFKRNRNFKEDFYFEDFKMQTVITPNMRNRNTNVIECSFTIIEPNGFTLINRMIAAANEINTGYVRAPGSYIQVPYVLQIDFFGYKETEDSKPEKIKDLTKIIPIKIINIETSVRQSGAEYRIEAVPYNHGAYSQINVSLPYTTKIQGSTVASIFNYRTNTGENVSSFSSLSQNQKNTEREISQLRKQREDIIQSSSTTNVDSSSFFTSLDDVDTRLSSATTRLASLKDTVLDVNSVCAAFNDYYAALKERGDINHAPRYEIEFDEEIANATLYSGPQPTNVASAGTVKSNAKTDAQSAGGAAKGGSLALSSGVINIPAGTSIEQLIDFIVRQSSYILDQIYLPQQAQVTLDLQSKVQSGSNVAEIVDKLSKSLKWFKIVPTMKIGQWDSIQGRYVPEVIRFSVKTFKISSKYPYGPRGRVPGYVKKYDYLFTGRNRDIIDWNINFNTLYLMAVTAGLNKSVQGSTGAGLNAAGNAADPTRDGKTTAGVSTLGDVVATPGVAPIAGDNKSSSIEGGNIQKNIASADLKNSLFLDSRGDMIELDLKIIGDPLFIKQDDVFYSRPGAGENPALTPNKSLYMDTGELYIFVNFLSPVDYDEEKGLAEIKANDILGPEKSVIEARNLGYSNFSGVYKLITVDSTFVRGKFEQNLRMAKVLFDQIGLPVSELRQRQVQQVAQEINTGVQLTSRFAAVSNAASNEFFADVNNVNSLLLNNFGLGGENILGQGLNVLTGIPQAGRLVGQLENLGTSVQRTLGGIQEGLSTVRQTVTQALPTPAPSIIDVGWNAVPGNGV